MTIDKHRAAEIGLAVEQYRSRKNLNGLLDDPELMDIFKDFVRYIAIPDRERRKAEMEIE